LQVDPGVARLKYMQKKQGKNQATHKQGIGDNYQ
jgi:hypothetical protein